MQAGDAGPVIRFDTESKASANMDPITSPRAIAIEKEHEPARREPARGLLRGVSSRRWATGVPRFDQRLRPKWAKARLASAMRCVFSRVVTALPSLWAASQSSFASRMWICLPRSSRAATMIQRKVSDC